ncbi:MAG: PEP-CTERM sorting domain-containing protein [Nitrospirae bacterium]|nr:PEP-CTERM sorting domain-containing protein [Nitrospirota bacterium]
MCSKKHISILAVSLVLLICGQAFALTSYSYTDSTYSFFQDDHNLGWKNQLPTSSGTFIDAHLKFDVRDSFKGSATFGLASITKTMHDGHTEYDVDIVKQLGTIYFGKTFDFTGAALQSLNAALLESYVKKTPLSFALILKDEDDKEKVRRATLYGNVAPEPTSMALVGAGLLGLPIAARFRRFIAKG